jgi:hypothetical protein
MAIDLLQQVREEIEDRMAPLAVAVTESRRLAEALVALGGLGVKAGRPSSAVAAVSRDGRAPARAVAGAGEAGRPKAVRRRRKPGARGASDQLVLEAMRGQSGVVDIKTVARKTGLSQHAASYNLKKLADAGVLTQSAISGSRGMPKLMFGLAKAGKGAGAEANGSKRAAPQTTSAATPKAKRNVRKKARRGTRRALLPSTTGAARGV